MSAAVRTGRYVLDWLADGAAFVVNILGEGQKPLLAHFGKGFEPGESAFDGVDARRSGETAPVLLTSHAYLDCRVTGRHAAGDHVLVIGRVVGGVVQHEGKPATHVRRSGMHY